MLLIKSEEGYLLQIYVNFEPNLFFNQKLDQL